ncbi:MAG: dTDP-4-dehydrorhamnose 3,5-epimerase family protein, partial [Hyphomicrobiaceae bacterium]
MTARFDLAATPLAGLTLLTRKPLGDARGFLERMYCANELREAGLERPIRQINRTFTSRAGTLRGLHFQYPPAMETKIVTCLRGRVFDVAVDLRAG